MSEQRLRLDGILRRVLQETVGEIHLYYQPPANLKMQYPCIRYDLNRIRRYRRSPVLSHSSLLIGLVPPFCFSDGHSEHVMV